MWNISKNSYLFSKITQQINIKHFSNTFPTGLITRKMQNNYPRDIGNYYDRIPNR